MSHWWTTADESYLRANYESSTSLAIATVLGRTPVAVRVRACKLGLRRGFEKYQGRPCPRGHSGIRYRSNWNCVECSQ